MGNVNEATLGEIWRSADYRRHRLEMRRCRSCLWNCQTELSLLFNPVDAAQPGDN